MCPMTDAAAGSLPTPPAGMERAGGVGGGTMGSGIVHVLLAAGFAVTLVDANEAALERAAGLVASSLDAAATRGKLPVAPGDLLARLVLAVDLADLDCADVVIEAVPERIDLKRSVLASIEAVVRPEALLATNTSSLSLTALGSALVHPERFVGTHFFNPVPAQPLLELVRPPMAAEGAVARARELAVALGKEVVEVTDTPGFATSRLGVALGLEATRMVQEGVATPEDIDRAMVLGYRYPMGPCRLGDLVGHDVRLGIAEYLAEHLGPRFEPPQLLRDMVADGRLGKKTGRGFYEWD